MNDITMHVIAKMRSDFASKFGIPRQSGLVDRKSGLHASGEGERVIAPEPW